MTNFNKSVKATSGLEIWFVKEKMKFRLFLNNQYILKKVLSVRLKLNANVWENKNLQKILWESLFKRNNKLKFCQINRKTQPKLKFQT